MMSLTTFSFKDNSVRIEMQDGEPWFRADDVCAVLGFVNPRQALATHLDGDDVQKLDTVDNLGKKQLVNHINETGVYALVFGSTLPDAKAFKKWVFKEVLPSIRKTGSYTEATITPAQQRELQKVVSQWLTPKQRCGRVDPFLLKAQEPGLKACLWSARRANGSTILGRFFIGNLWSGVGGAERGNSPSAAELLGGLSNRPRPATRLKAVSRTQHKGVQL